MDRYGLIRRIILVSAASMCAAVLTASGCKKLEKPAVTPGGGDAAATSVFRGESGEGEARYYTFSTDRPYRIEFSVSRADFQAAEALLKEIDRESIANSDGRMFGIDRTDKDFLLLYWQCIYNSMQRQSRDVIERLAGVFRKIKTDNGLNDMQTIYAIARFVQFMQYYIPPGIGIYSPARVLLEPGKGTPGEPPQGNATGWHGAGDCDTKSLLMVLLLQTCGYDAVVLDSYRYHHAMAAVHFPGMDGVTVDHRGKSYLVIESTYPNWNIGQLPQQYTDLSYFLPIDPRENMPGADAALRAFQARDAAASSQGAAEREPNNSRESADKVTELVLDGFMGDDDAEDWFRLGGQESTSAAFTIVHGPDCDFNFEVYNDASVAANASGTGDADTVFCEIPGTCHVRVVRVRGSGPYMILITPGGTSEKEPNNAPGEESQCSTASVYGQIETAGDVDYYALGGREGFNATYTIYHGGENQFSVEVFNDGTSVGRSSGAGAGGSFTAEHPNRVSMKVSGNRGTGWYLVRIKRNR
ncbi:MAG TPA: hypothetical protein PKY31_02825 [Spirochaetota bacterium]|nr:hypothetical protein [Spirochaetota bacterium]